MKQGAGELLLTMELGVEGEGRMIPPWTLRTVSESVWM